MIKKYYDNIKNWLFLLIILKIIFINKLFFYD